MKSTNMAYLILSTATVLLFLCLSPLTTTAANTAVLDIDGHPLQAGTNYNVLPVIRVPLGGGLTLASRNSSTQSCPLYVAQDTAELSKGLPLKFYPVNPKDKTIPLTTDLNVVFDASTTCVQSTQWKFTNDEAEGRPYVGTGGTIGNPGVQTLGNWFKIEKAGSGKYDYKFVFCPGVCDFCRPFCGDVGVFQQRIGTRVLGINTDNMPLLVNFKKA